MNGEPRGTKETKEIGQPSGWGRCTRVCACACACACVCAVVVEWQGTDIDGSDAACLVPCGSVHGVAWMTGTDSKGRVGGQCRASEPWAALRGSLKLNRRTGRDCRRPFRKREQHLQRRRKKDVGHLKDDKYSIITGA